MELIYLPKPLYGECWVFVFHFVGWLAFFLVRGMSDMIVLYSGVGRNISSVLSMEAEVELTQLVYAKGVEKKSWSWRADDLI